MSDTMSAAARRQALLNTAPKRMIAVADATGVTRHLPPSRFTDLGQGRVGVLARPGMRRIGWLAADILGALGCAEGVTGAGRAGEGDWSLVAVWLNTHQVRHLYIQHAWTLPYPVLEEVTTLLERTAVTVWLVGDTQMSDFHRDILSPWTPPTISGEQFTAAWGDITPHPATPTHGDRIQSAAWPEQVPTDDFTTFRSACRDLLSVEHFTAVDGYLRDRYRSTVRFLHEHDGTPLTEETVAGWLQQQWEDVESLAHFITLLRAAQVAFFRAGHYLQVDLDQLVGTASTMPRRALRSPDTWARLHAYPEPHRAAICALAAAGVAAAQIRQVTVAGYLPDTTVVRLADGNVVDIEPDAAVYLTAQWHLRMQQGADDGALLLPGHRGRPIAERAVVQIINDARRELGVAVAPARPDRKPVTGHRWTTRWGISIQELT